MDTEDANIKRNYCEDVCSVVTEIEAKWVKVHVTRRKIWRKRADWYQREIEKTHKRWSHVNETKFSMVRSCCLWQRLPQQLLGFLRSKGYTHQNCFFAFIF